MVVEGSEDNKVVADTESPGLPGQRSLQSNASSAGIGLTDAQVAGLLQLELPEGVGPGTVISVAVPDSGGQVLWTEVPPGMRPGETMVVPYEIAASGIAQHPLQYPEGAPTVLTTATVPPQDGWADQPYRKTIFCNCRCVIEVICILGLSLAVSIAPALLMAEVDNQVVATLGLVLSAVLPTCVLMGYCYCKFWRSLLKCQMVITFVEAALWLTPFIGMFFLLKVVGYFGWCGCEEECPSDASGDATGSNVSAAHSDEECERVCDQGLNCYGHDAFTAFILASLCEEILKYLAIRRIVFASLVVDARSMLVYGGCSALGFATVENVLYVLKGGVKVAATRAVLSVPLHMSTGLLMGCSLGYARFFGKPVWMWKVLVIPVLVHGFYDVFLFVSVRMGGDWPILGFLLAIGTSVVAWLRIRLLVIDLEAVPALDVRDLLKQGIVQRPACCLPCCWERRDAAPVKLGGERRCSSDGQAYTFEEFVQFFGREEAVQRWALATPAGSSVPPRVFGETHAE